MESITTEFFKNISGMDRKEYLNCFLTYMVSPVIMDIKPAMTIAIHPADICNFREWRTKLSNEKIDYLEVKRSEDKVTLIVYNEERLEHRLNEPENRNILVLLGYEDHFTLKEKLDRLKLRMTESQFPHEIGVFLGIPAEDVLGFINGDKCVHCGYWKVYKNLKEAKKTFKLYDSSKNLVMEHILRGKNLDDTLKAMKKFKRREYSLNC